MAENVQELQALVIQDQAEELKQARTSVSVLKARLHLAEQEITNLKESAARDELPGDTPEGEQ